MNRRFQFPAAVTMKGTTVCNLTPCSPVGVACLAYSSMLEMEALCSNAWRRVAEDSAVLFKEFLYD